MTVQTRRVEFDMERYVEKIKHAYANLAEAERQEILFHFKDIGVTFAVIYGQIVPVEIDRPCTDCSSVAVVSKRKRK